MSFMVFNFYDNMFMNYLNYSFFGNFMNQIFSPFNFNSPYFTPTMPTLFNSYCNFNNNYFLNNNQNSSIFTPNLSLRAQTESPFGFLYQNKTNSNYDTNLNSNTAYKHSSSRYHWTELSDNEMRNIYGNYDRDVTILFNGTAEDLNKFLNTKSNSVLKGKGEVFMEAQRKYGISALVLLGICGQETGFGTTGNASPQRGYNIANISKPKNANYKGRWKRYNSPDECIMDLAKLLKNNYVNDSGKSGVHLKKLYQINSKYCPVGETEKNKDWARGVENCIKTVEKSIA